MWRLLEPLHAVTYFAGEAIEARCAAGLRGFWMGYFAGRAAPMGAVEPAVVEAAFYNFAPSMVRRAIPDAWRFASPARVIQAQLSGADEVLGRVLGAVVDPGAVRQATGLAIAALDGLPVDGRPLAAAYLALAVPDGTLAALWQVATTLREHRGDGHVAALVDAEIDGCEAHLTNAAAGGPPRSVLQPARGWSDDDWDAAEERLRARGLLDERGRLTDSGSAVRAKVEETTDRLAAAPWTRLGERRTVELEQLLAPLAGAVWASGVLPGENPMGLPAS
jgi:hypothetical protein